MKKFLTILSVLFTLITNAQTVTDPWATLGPTNIQTAFIAMDASNNMYVTNFINSTISKITPSGIVTQAWATLAANSRPYGITIDASGNLYTVNRNSPYTVSKITPSSDGSSGTVIQTWATIGAEAYTITVDASGNIFVPYVSTNKIAKIVPASGGATGTITNPWVTLATGANPFSISFDASGNLYTANSNNTISKITPAGSVTQVWATLDASSNPQFMVFDAASNLYVSCWGTSTVSKINSSGTVTNVWSVGTNVWPAGIVLDDNGNIYTANYNNNTISKITSSGTVTQSFVTLASGSNPFYLSKDVSGNLYVTNMGNGTVTKIGVQPSVTITSSASGTLCSGSSVTFTANIYNFTSTPTYQWTKNGIAIPGANSATYSTTTLSNNDQIKVWVNAGINNSAIVSNGLLLNLDASNPGSYAGTGNNWYDLSGNNNHATLMNSPTYDATSGSIVTNGTNQYISIPQFSTANTNITMQAWVYVNLNTTGTFMKNGTGGGGYSIGIGNGAYDQVGSNVVMLLYGRGWIGSGVSYGSAGWKLVTLTLDGSSTARAYVNGSLIGTYTWPTPTAPAGAFNIGANIGDGNIYYNGKFAAAYFYNRALSLTEIQQNYNAFATKTTGYGSNTITISITGAVPTLTMNGDACINKTTLTTTSGLTSYAWYKDNVVISGATTNSYTPTASGSYLVQVSTGTCTSTSTATTIYNCAVGADGKMSAITNASTIISPEGGANFGTGRDIAGKLYNTTSLTTINSTIGATTAIVGGVISPTNATTSSIGLIYSTDVNFGTYTSTTIQSNVAAGTYTSTITGLNSLTSYYAKSFIINKAGTSYSTTVSFTTTSPPVAVGSSYGGGVVYYILRSGDLGYDANVQHGLIAATSDQSNGVDWAKTNTNIGATAENIGYGLSNTNLIIANQGNTGTYGAKIARDYNGGGYTDWFLPSAQELHTLFLATSLLGVNALGSNTYYLSSTEYSTTNCIYEGTMGDYYKQPGNGAYPAGTTKTYNGLHVRAIRSF